MNIISHDKTGEARVWWHWQSLANRRDWQHGRAWLHWPGNSAGIEWSIGGKGMGASIHCCDPVIGDEALTLHLALPFFFSVWLMLQNFPSLKRLPGVKWNRDDYNSGERMLSLSCHHGAMWWRLWRNPDVGYGHDWRDSNFNPARFFLGHPKYSEGPRNQFDTYLEMPEGVYPVSVEIYTATWKRPRWPWGKSAKRADIEIKARPGIPIPDKGDNGWDMDDDAIYGLTCLAGTVTEAVEALRQSVERDRKRHGGKEGHA